jgi:hypothetical protein
VQRRGKRHLPTSCLYQRSLTMLMSVLALLRCGVVGGVCICYRPSPFSHTPCCPSRWTSTNQVRPKLAVGDTCYATVRLLNVHGWPYLTAPCHAQFGPQQLLTVLDLPNSEWAHVSYRNEDIGINGYVSQLYLARKKKVE